MQKSRNHSSIGNLAQKNKDLSASKVAQKSLSKNIKIKRSSMHHLNQYSKLLLLQKNEDPKSLALLKRQGTNVKNLIQCVANTKRQSLSTKVQQIQKLNLLLQVYKKKTASSSVMGTPVTPQFNNNYIQSIEVTQTLRTIKTSQTNSRKSLHKKGSSMGKLYLGKNILPERILLKQQRLNPFYQQPRIITENIITSKGVYNLINAGILPPEYDFLQILNNKYQPLTENPSNPPQKAPQQVMKIQEQTQTFMTNPALMNQYQQHKKMSQAQLFESSNLKNLTEELEKKKQNKIRKTKLKKVKKIKNNDPLDKLSQLLVFDLPILVISNGKLLKDQNYNTHLKLSLKNGTQVEFFQLIQKMQNFVAKYNIKKIKFKPNPLFVKRITQTYLLSSIENYKIYGLDKTVRAKQNIVNSVVLRALDMHTMKKVKFYLKKIQNLKKYFRMRKLYHECVEKRYNFFKYRLGSFAQQQRKYIQEFIQNRMTISDYYPKVQIHLLTKEATYPEENTYYKLRQRLRAHLMRLANCEPIEIILLVDPIIVGDVMKDMEVFFNTLTKLFQKLQKIQKHIPKIHVFSSKSGQQKVSYTGRTYFGISSDVIKAIKQIIKKQKPVLIPYESSKLIPFICQTFNANLFGGTFTKESIELIFQQNIDRNQEEGAKVQLTPLQSHSRKFQKIQIKHTFQNMIKKLKKFQMANYLYEDKSKIYDIFSVKLKKSMPFRINTKNKNQNEFYQQLVAKIISHKDSMRWIFKLGKGKFSRGIAILQTIDLKIFQQNRKKSELNDDEIAEISKLMNLILGDKIVLSHGNLMQKKQFLRDFLSNENSYVQEFIQNSHKICIFGKILPNGHFVFMGSYKKHYTNGVGFGASYPAEQVNEQILEELKQLSMGLFEQNVFGYATFELLYQQKTKKFFYLDFTPNLQEYSSLYFLYHSLFKAENMYSDYFEFNRLPKNIFYCPFLDNNGNKFDNLDDFLNECRIKKIWYNPVTQEGQRYMFYQNDPSVLSLLVFSNSQFQSIKMSIEAISFLVETGGKFYQFDKKYMEGKDSKTDGLYMMDILWKLRQMRKKMEGSLMQPQKGVYE